MLQGLGREHGAKLSVWREVVRERHDVHPGPRDGVDPGERAITKQVPDGTVYVARADLAYMLTYEVLRIEIPDVRDE